MNRLTPCRALLALAAAGAAIAQSTGGFSPSSSGAAAAGGSPVGMVLPWTVQLGSTAPTLPGHAITAQNRPTGTSWPGSTSTAKVLASAPSQTGAALNEDVLMDSHVLAWASAAKPTTP